MYIQSYLLTERAHVVKSAGGEASRRARSPEARARNQIYQSINIILRSTSISYFYVYIVNTCRQSGPTWSNRLAAMRRGALVAQRNVRGILLLYLYRYLYLYVYIYSRACRQSAPRWSNMLAAKHRGARAAQRSVRGVLLVYLYLYLHLHIYFHVCIVVPGGGARPSGQICWRQSIESRSQPGGLCVESYFSICTYIYIYIFMSIYIYSPTCRQSAPKWSNMLAAKRRVALAAQRSVRVVAQRAPGRGREDASSMVTAGLTRYIYIYIYMYIYIYIYI